MENDVLQCKDLLIKSMSYISQVLAWRKNKYGSKISRFSEANDGDALTTISDEKKKDSKKKNIKCYKFNKVEHYSNGIDEEETRKQQINTALVSYY